jgi:NADP-reducing hydrogenase subunit HndC
MEPFRYHVYCCTQEKPDNAPCCAARGSQAVLEALRAELGKSGLGDVVQVTTSGSIGLCERGPNMVVYPEGVWYSGVQVADIPEIVREHFAQGRPVARLLNTDPVALKAEILENRRKAIAAMQARAAAQQKG